jgi:hypothetical protein
MTDDAPSAAMTNDYISALGSSTASPFLINYTPQTVIPAQAGIQARGLRRQQGLPVAQVDSRLRGNDGSVKV